MLHFSLCNLPINAETNKIEEFIFNQIAVTESLVFGCGNLRSFSNNSVRIGLKSFTFNALTNNLETFSNNTISFTSELEFGKGCLIQVNLTKLTTFESNEIYSTVSGRLTIRMHCATQIILP